MEWLSKGLKFVDPKLRHIAKLNEMLAHKPWIIDSSVIEVINLDFEIF